MTAQAEPPARRRASPWPRVIAVILGVLLILVAIAWLNRRAAARELLVGWLERKGVKADVQLERIELDGLTARVRIGDPRNPDATVERVEVDYVLGAPWSRAGLGVTPRRIRLVRPVVRARLVNGTLSFGALDPLIAEFRKKPPRPDTRGPLILVEQGKVRLDTAFGRVEADADARIDNGKLMRLRAIAPPATLKRGALSALGLTGVADLTTVADRITGRIGLAADRFEGSGLGGQGLRGAVVVDLPYPDLRTRRGDGRAAIDATLSADRLTVGSTSARTGVLHAAFDGQVSGWIETFRLQGDSEVSLAAARLDGPGLTGRRATATLHASDARLARDARGLAWRLRGAGAASLGEGSAGGIQGRSIALRSDDLTVSGRGAALEASGPVVVSADRAAAGDFSLAGLRSGATVHLVTEAGWRLDAAGALAAAHGAWPLFGRPARDDVPELGEMKRALSDFAVSAPAFRLVTGSGGTRVILSRPAVLRPANGGVLTVNPRGGPVFEAAPGRAGGGALDLVSRRGRGLPEATVAVPRWRLTPGGFAATLDGRAALDFGLARGLTLRTRGELASNRGRLTWIASGCAPLTVERLELGENDVTALSGDFCPQGGPMLSVADGAWRAHGALRGIDASAPFLALDIRQASGVLTAIGGPHGLGLDVQVDAAGVEDATTPRRFNPLTAAGSARLADERWSGAFDLARDGTALGRLTLAHDGRAGAGGLIIEAPSIAFAPGGLQPADLSPLIADLVRAPATGSVAFTGRVDWRDGQEGTSSGRLDVAGIDFTSPAGPVKGLKGVIDFTSLAPLTTAPDQHLTADRVEAFAPLTGVDVAFALDKSALMVSAGQLTVGGGAVRVEPFAVPLDRTLPLSGVITLENIQLGDLVAGSGFGDKVKLDALVSGRLPFSSDPVQGWRITGGSLRAARPGRLSIQREALSGLQAGGGGAGVPPNTVQDLAYQAMENLAFDTLTAEVNSLDQGRLGVLFHIRGRHDPPERQELRLSLSELIGRKFLNRPLTLPSDTGIDLTLDTTLNLNQLVADVIALNRARNGRPDAPEASPPPGP